MITLALIGVGNWGKKIISESKLVKDLKIKYLCSPNIKSKNIEGKFLLFTDYQKLILQADIDGVIIATPVEKHFEIASYFITNQIPVFIEKPFFNSMEHTKKFALLVKKHGVVCMFSKIYFFHRELKEIIHRRLEGGAISSVEIAFGNKGSNEGNRSVVTEWFPHVFDILSVVSDKLPLSLCVKKEREKNDELTVTINYKDFSAIAHVGWDFPRRKRQLMVKYEKGIVRIGDLSKVEGKSNGNSPLFYELVSLKDVLISGKVLGSDLVYSIDIMRLLSASQLSLEKEGREIFL